MPEGQLSLATALRPEDWPAAWRHSRGFGLVYCGSIEEVHGAVVMTMDDCECAECVQLDPWNPLRRVRVRFMDWRVVEHARLSSFRRS